jgi:hypothetical protein
MRNIVEVHGRLWEETSEGWRPYDAEAEMQAAIAEQDGEPWDDLSDAE